jgi:GT2 family glycosyltransferase
MARNSYDNRTRSTKCAEPTDGLSPLATPSDREPNVGFEMNVNERPPSYAPSEFTAANAPALLERQATDFPAVSVIIPAYTMDRWDSLCETVASAQAQTVPVLETIVVVDHQPQLLASARRELPNVRAIPSVGIPGVSGARNTGVAASRGDIVAFLDDDAMASPNWLATLLRHFAHPDVVGAGGYIDPLWDTARPSWLPPEFDWAIGTSYLGMPTAPAVVRNVWTNSMIIRREAFEAAGGFRDDFGKIGNRNRPEDTDLCVRVASANKGGIWVYDPDGIVAHRVSAKRATLRYFVARCFDEGWGKGVLAGLDGFMQSTSLERAYVWRVLPAGIGRGLRDAASGNASGLLRSVTIALGLCVAVVGYLASRCISAWPCRKRHSD